MSLLRGRYLRPALMLAAASSLAVWSDTARALDKAACVSAADNGQRLRKEHKLLASREFFIQCARSECPAMVSQDCVQWLGDAERKVASVVVKAKDAHGREITDVRMSVDGVVVSDRPTAAPIEVDPGQHTFRYESSSFNPVEERVELSEGERGRILAVEFHESATPVARPGTTGPGTTVPGTTGPGTTATGDKGGEKPAEASSPGSGLRVASLVIAGLGVVGVGVFAGLSLSANSDQDALKGPGGCAPNCQPAQTDPIQSKFTAANVSLGIGLGAIGVAAVLFIVSVTQHSEPAKAALAFPSEGIRF